LGTNPPTVIQLQIDGTGNRERSGLDVHSDDEKQLKHSGVVMTRSAGPGDPQDNGGHAKYPRSDDEEDLRTTALRS
jgi:hypothetical protein